jgi:hypothetical protein
MICAPFVEREGSAARGQQSGIERLDDRQRLDAGKKRIGPRRHGICERKTRENNGTEKGQAPINRR